MEPEFWLDRWASNNIMGFHLSEANPALVAHFDKLDLPQGARVFVPLCGKTLDMRWLRDQGCRVAGSELSEIAIDQFFEELGETPRVTDLGALKKYSTENIDIFVGDIFDLDAGVLGEIDATYDRAAIVALPPAMRVHYTAHLKEITDRAPQLVITFTYDETKMDGPPFSVSDAEVERHYKDAYDVTLVTRNEMPFPLRGIVQADQIVWVLK